MLHQNLLPIIPALAILASPTPALAQSSTNDPTTQAGQQQVQQEPVGEQDPNVEGVQQKVDTQNEDKEAELRQKIIEESVTALNETERALRALDDGDTETALEAIERAVGKLEVVLARSPDLALAPVRVTTTTHDLFLDRESIEDAVDQVEDLMDDRRVQEARQILTHLASEIVYTTTYLPMATFPDAIAGVTPLIDRGDLDEAKRRLNATLGTMIVIDHVVPLPIVRAEYLLDEAETLAENSDRESSESDRLTELLDSAEEQLRIAQVLGYGEKKDFEPLYEEIESIREKTEDDKSGEGFFTDLRDGITSLRDKIFG